MKNVYHFPFTHHHHVFSFLSMNMNTSTHTHRSQCSLKFHTFVINVKVQQHPLQYKRIQIHSTFLISVICPFLWTSSSSSSSSTTSTQLVVAYAVAIQSKADFLSTHFFYSNNSENAEIIIEFAIH